MTQSIDPLSEAISQLIPVSLLTGFLGSGKTTLLNTLVQQPEMADTLVIINEFGEMALDHMLVAHSTENLVMEMSSGCVCCSIRGDLVETLDNITWRYARDGKRWFKRVMIETTGLADPAPIVQTLMTHPKIVTKYRLDGIAATVDVAAGMNTLDRHHEAVKQAAMADVLLLTKSDLVTEAQRDELLERLAVINPAAPRWEVRDGEIEARKVLDLGLLNPEEKSPDVARWLKEEAYAETESHEHDHHHGHEHEHHDVNRHDDHIRAFCLTMDEPIPEAFLANWHKLLMSYVGGQILRMKAILNIEGKSRPLVVHGVQHVFHPPVTLPAWPSDDRRSRMVFITNDVSQEAIEMIRSMAHTLRM